MKLLTHQPSRLNPGAFLLVLNLVLAESSIETVPNEIVGHPAVLNWAHRKRKDPRRLILDQNYHFAAIQKLGSAGLKRGRPDIVHFCLLLALGSPLNLRGRLQCYVHTVQDRIIKVDPKARLPRNTDRWVSLLEQLYEEKVVPPMGPALLTLTPGTVASLLDEVNPDLVLALTTEGELKSMEQVGGRLAASKRPVLLVGGFAEGHFSKSTMSRVNESYRVDRRRLEAWTVVSRGIYDYERQTEKEDSARN